MAEAYQITVGRAVIPGIVKVLRKHDMEKAAKDAEQVIGMYGARTVDLMVQDWPLPVVDAVIKILDEVEVKACAYLRAVKRVLINPAGSTVRKLELLPKAMAAYLLEEVIDGWVYEAREGTHIAWLVTDIEYHSEDRYHRSPAAVTMKLKANRAAFSGDEEEESNDDGKKTCVLTWSGSDIVRRATAASLLLSEGYLKETPELKAEYTKNLERFEKYRPQHSKQFLCSDYAMTAAARNWWARNSTEAKYPLPHPTKMVNEEEVLGRKITLAHSNTFWHSYGVKYEDVLFTVIPVQPYILFFDLTRHAHCWVHPQNCKPYKYDKTLREKLILPEAHRDLIDVLIADMDVFQEDIIAGKSGGTPVLCYGAPGLGKTLTAEVYAELAERPLYRVAAGQLGVEVSTVDTMLEKILRRSERWGAALLLDEADVYIRQRSNDINHNAIVAAVLQKLEYFHGLLFLTTNRKDDVDEAIASRMVATFKYEAPDDNDSARLWKVLGVQFEVNFPDGMLVKLTKEFPNIPGRDIKQLLKLAIKYCRRKEVKLSMDVFRKCAVFRGIK